MNNRYRGTIRLCSKDAACVRPNGHGGDCIAHSCGRRFGEACAEEGPASELLKPLRQQVAEEIADAVTLNAEVFVAFADELLETAIDLRKNNGPGDVHAAMLTVIANAVRHALADVMQRCAMASRETH